MTPLLKFFRDAAQKALGKFYEGPEPPRRLGELVLAFAEAHPKATRGEWARFAQLHAEEAYRQGYVRGYEYVEREEGFFEGKRPEELADQLDPDWRWRPGITLDGASMGEVPSDEGAEYFHGDLVVAPKEEVRGG